MKRPHEHVDTAVVDLSIFASTCMCLTGFSTERKKELHKKIESLGGRFTRDLLTASTTHLIAERAEGAKFKEAKRCSNIEIVTPKWIEMCALIKEKVPTSNFYLVNSALDCNKGKFELSLQDTCDELLERIPANPMLSGCCFLLVGFSNKDWLGTNFNSLQQIHQNAKNDEELKFKQSLSKMIRRCMGTIYWDIHANITHVIVNEAEMKLSNALANFCSNHGNNPKTISPEWVIACLKSRRLQEEKDYPPQKRRIKTLKTKKKIPQSTTRQLDHFHGFFFQLCDSLQNAFTCNVMFKEDKVEKMIASFGGRILSREGIQLLRSSRDKSPECYVVNLSGPFNLEQCIRDDPLLNQITQHNLCTIIPVTVSWLQTCNKNKSLVEPAKLNMLFQPQPWPLRRIQGIKLKVAVTGFQGIERTGLSFVLLAIGANYTENMDNKNTHLICKEDMQQGPKFQKAMEWGLRIVKVQWLHHIMQNGYKKGCEHEFSLEKRNKDV